MTSESLAGCVKVVGRRRFLNTLGWSGAGSGPLDLTHSLTHSLTNLSLTIYKQTLHLMSQLALSVADPG
jgi:hypothetical protein